GGSGRPGRASEGRFAGYFKALPLVRRPLSVPEGLPRRGLGRSGPKWPQSRAPLPGGRLRLNLRNCALARFLLRFGECARMAPHLVRRQTRMAAFKPSDLSKPASIGVVAHAMVPG